tara:strand:- start:1050 stop:1970 length:921 start_codon:yes stop_codon:yes gene_type:complete
MSQENQQGQVTENLEDSLFAVDNVDSIFEPGLAENAPEQIPEPQAEGSAVVDDQIRYAKPESNEEVRSSYWQSEADKAKNENDQLKQTVGILQDTIARVPANVQPEEISEPEPEPFRSPPEKPIKPAGFNRADSIDDPNSASSQYLDSMDSYRDTMDTYNAERVQYEGNLLKQEREAVAEQQRQQQDAFQAEQRNKEQVDSISSELRNKFNANDSQIKEFIETMSNPESLNVDNLWRLYQMDKGQVPAQQATQPSPEFNQVQRAQSVPAPMGVQTAANMQQNGKSPSDSIMDDLIRDYESKNPWNN